MTVDKPGDTSLTDFHVAGFRAANTEHSIKDLRWALAHVNYITPEQTRALVAMGVGVTGKDINIRPNSKRCRWGLRGECCSTPASIWARAPMGPSPRDSTPYYMTTGKLNTGALGNSGQTVSRLEALKIHTKGSAWHSFDDDKLGTIEVGKLADLAVLSDDPLTVSDDKLRRITSKLTLQAGKTVHERDARKAAT